jgi:hypothetical protein
MRIVSALAAAALSVVVASQAHAVIILDGAYDAAYGASTAHVGYDAGAPIGNFGTPGPNNHITSYDIFLTYDSGNVYGFLQNMGPAASTAGIAWANLYFDTDPAALNGSDLGFEIVNNNAFIPGVSGSVATPGVQFATTAQGLEFLIPASYFTSPIAGLGAFPLVAPGGMLQLRLSQSFGYSVAGGDTFGADRLGEIQIGSAVPEPSTWAMMLIGFAGLGFMAYRRTRKMDALVRA